jgi:hypothetical protein
MYITKETLLKYGACGFGLKWFERNFPNGGELIDVINHPKIDRHSLHWGYTNLITTETELEAYYKKLKITNNEHINTITYSDNVQDSLFVSRSSYVEKSNFVFSSEDIVDSSNISSSKVVQRSKNVFNSEFVYDSNQIYDGKNINNSYNIISANYIINSENVVNAASVINSKMVVDLVPNGTKQIKNSAFISHCSNLDHCLFCQCINNGEYLVFNKPVSAEEYDIIVTQLNNMLSNVELDLTLNGWPKEQIPLDTPIINRNFGECFSILPDKFWRWVKTLPNYDPMILYGITYNLRIDLTERK